METHCREEMYKGIRCVIMENDDLKVTIIPEAGGKIQSIYDKRLEFEYLYPSTHDSFIRPRYGMSFDDGELSGFDDMFPTISSCIYPEPPWEGVRLPDHGEVWSIPWDMAYENDAVEVSCYGVKIPYRLIKTIRLCTDSRISIQYKLLNPSPFALKFIWAAHPLVNIDESSEVLLPSGVTQIFHTYDGPGQPNAFGRIGNWDDEQGRYGNIADPGREMCAKYYVYGPVQKGECAIYSNRTQRYFKLSYDVERLPYLAVWINWDGYAVKQRNMALEPCTGAPDGIDIAQKYGWLPEVPPKGSYHWSLEIKTGKSPDKNAVIS